MGKTAVCAVLVLAMGCGGAAFGVADPPVDDDGGKAASPKWLETPDAGNSGIDPAAPPDAGPDLLGADVAVSDVGISHDAPPEASAPPAADAGAEKAEAAPPPVDAQTFCPLICDEDTDCVVGACVVQPGAFYRHVCGCTPAGVCDRAGMVLNPDAGTCASP